MITVIVVYAFNPGDTLSMCMITKSSGYWCFFLQCIDFLFFCGNNVL